MSLNPLRAALIGLASLSLVACSGEEEKETSQMSEAETAEPASGTEEGAALEDQSLEDLYAAAIANPLRPESDRERDEGRKPAEVLAFFGVEPGMRVVDLHAGGGYFTRLFADIVGPEGGVVSHNSPRRVPEKDRPAREAAFEGYDNIEFAYADPKDLDMADGSVDFVFLGLVYHHWHYGEDTGEELPPASVERLANVYRMLKPGGVFGVIEHKAADDASRADSAAIHRVPPAIAEADITGAGFVLEGTSDIHTYPEDDVTLFWRENTPRGRTNRFVHFYRKPLVKPAAAPPGE